MITKWIEFTVEENDVNAFSLAMTKLELESSQEQGCAHYSVYQSKDEAALFTVLESWETSEAFEAHRVAPHIAEFKTQCAKMILNKRALELNAIRKEN
ncbi:antibiotic biosynthesis monooxygenase [Lentisphaera profundi]|uniref:Antibiotic biosynthesis monooxygenase n=1 Tax=Lentisphaera profundi TaxID=1658616 RepID=A0ABY7VT82_9BACT|nr:antibiotic biosynthesis monooxygenase [Lentisphaera profundi]WDE97262.1 antibiotic biosynthesis monooxygenase [Lentisphaera profundi]